ARHNQGEAAQSGPGCLRLGDARVWRGAAENAQDGGTLRPGEFTARAEGGGQISGFEDGGLSGRRERLVGHGLGSGGSAEIAVPAPTEQGGGGLAARHNQGETAQSGPGSLRLGDRGSGGALLRTLRMAARCAQVNSRRARRVAARYPASKM